MSYSPKISVIVPVYKAEVYIERCARSLFGQTLDNLEFIFVNDCTPDRSMDILNKVLAQFPDRVSQVKMIDHETNRGVATARNTGLEYASGEYIGWCDSDDWVEPDMFEQLYQAIIAENADIVHCDYTLKNQGKEEIKSQFHSPFSLDCIKAILSRTMTCALHNKLARRYLYDKNNIRFPDGINMGEDLRVNIELFFHASKVAYVKKTLYHYVLDNSLMCKNSMISTEVDWEYIENIKAVESSLAQKGLYNLVQYLDYTKLDAKRNIIVQNTSIEYLKRWRDIFPETKGKLWFVDIPFFYKLLAWSIEKKLHVITWFLVLIKKIKTFTGKKSINKQK